MYKGTGIFTNSEQGLTSLDDQHVSTLPSNILCLPTVLSNVDETDTLTSFAETPEPDPGRKSDRSDDVFTRVDLGVPLPEGRELVSIRGAEDTLGILMNM